MNNNSINGKLNVRYYLSNIFGISIAKSSKIINKMGLGRIYKYIDLTNSQRYTITKYLSEKEITEILLREKNLLNRLNLYKNGSYRGWRQVKGYPSRGQRTRSNGNTSNRLKLKTK